MVGAHSYLDAEITRSSFGDEGKRPAATPTHTAGLWATYALPWRFLWGKWRLGFGVRYTGEQPGDFLNTFDVESSTLFDAALYYTYAGWRVSVTAKNLADTRYVAFCEGPDDCHRGDPLTVMATLQYRWK